METVVTMSLLQEIIDSFNRHDVDAVVAFFADDGEMLLPVGSEICGARIKGKAAIRETLSKRFADSPDIQWTEGTSWIFGNKALSEWRVRGTQPNGAKIDLLGCDLWEFRGDKIVKKDVYYKQIKR